jgi:hypothetical protein
VRCLHKYFAHDAAVYIGQATIDACMPKRQLLMINA